MATNTTPNEPTQGDTGSAANEGSVAAADVPAIPMHAFSSIESPKGLKNSAWHNLARPGRPRRHLCCGSARGLPRRRRDCALLLNGCRGARRQASPTPTRQAQPNALATVTALLLMLLVVLAVMGFVVQAVVNQAPAWSLQHNKASTADRGMAAYRAVPNSTTAINGLINNVQGG